MQNPEYKSVQGLLAHANEVSQFNKAFAYYTKAYATQKLHALYKKTPPSNEQKEMLSQLQALLSELEGIKSQNPAFANKEANKQSYQEFVYKLFFDADTRERDGEVSKELLQMFQACIKFFEVFNYFEPMTNDQLEKQKYAKMKMVDQAKKIKNPQLIQPKKTDPMEEELQQIANQTQQQQQPQQKQPQQIQQNPQGPQGSHYQNQGQSFQSTTQQQNHQGSSFQQPKPPITQQQFTPIPQQQVPSPMPQQQQTVQNPPKPTQQLSSLQQAQYRNEAKQLLQKALQELDFKKYQQAKLEIEKALTLIQQLPEQ